LVVSFSDCLISSLDSYGAGPEHAASAALRQPTAAAPVGAAWSATYLHRLLHLDVVPQGLLSHDARALFVPNLERAQHEIDLRRAPRQLDREAAQGGPVQRLGPRRLVRVALHVVHQLDRKLVKAELFERRAQVLRLLTAHRAAQKSTRAPL